MSRRRVSIAALAAAALLPCARGAGAELPPADRCPTLRGTPDAAGAEDAGPTLLREGMQLSAEDLLLLRELLPPEVWGHRSQFFHPGMRMEIGPCHRRYPASDAYAAASRAFAGRARLDAEGNLHDYSAGLPFLPDDIDPEAPDAAARWAWNLAYRYRGAGPSGRFRIVDMASRLGRSFRYEGTFFFLLTAHRADLADRDYAVPEAAGSLFVAGGRFSEPFDARHLAWRQIRPREAERRHTEPDDTFVYVPTMRKMRRAASTWVDGMFVPQYRASGDAGGGGLLAGGEVHAPGAGYPGGSINPSAARSIAATEHLPRGFTTLALRPNAYRFGPVREREVLAPLNVSRAGYPSVPDRNFGRSGLSLGGDRWEVRQAVVLEGTLRERGQPFDAITLYVDAQTQQPLYAITRRRGGRIVDITIPAHRFSGDRPDYPRFPGGARALVFDPVATVSYSALDGSGWRREAYGIHSLPLPGAQIRRYTSSAFLERGR